MTAADGPSIQVDLRTVPESSFGAALMYFTGSKEHNVRLRERAIKRGLTLNEYGLFPEDKAAGGPPQQRGVEPVASSAEDEVFRALGLAWVPPEQREDRGELALAAEAGPDGELPRLVEVADLRSELHSHTTASDGVMSIDEAAAEADRRGFHTLAITDHSKSTIGLSERRLRDHAERVRAKSALLEEAGSGLTLLAGSEVDILADGRMDYSDQAMKELDIVVASPHVSTNMEGARATTRLLRAIEHPLVHIVGHPTGRLIQRRRGMEPAMDEVYAAAREHGVALEINCHWMRLDLRDAHVRGAVEAGCLIAINCDVHEARDYDNARFGVVTARRGWCPPDRVVNTWEKERLLAWLARKR